MSDTIPTPTSPLSQSAPLRAYFKAHRDQDNYSDHFRLRIHRALSWLEKAEQTEDFDSQFIHLWIAFNAAYAREINGESKDRVNFNEFLLRICACDENQIIYHLVWKTFPQSIRLLMDNQYTFQPFWDWHNGNIDEKKYRQIEMRERERFLSALESQKTERILDTMFSRLYTVRNQILHGGATYNSRVNREQLRDSCRILQLLLPEMLRIMMKHHNEIDWGKPFYPVVQS
ncbi:hypothetical protein A4G19_01715 [Pasteurellaceae bacterium Macca]|nr:hypothetical protein [Pasteurellaceae bacterium Macca]